MRTGCWLTRYMSKQLRITVTEHGAPIARFDSVDDAMAFCATVTSDTARTLTITDRAGWVTMTVRNGFITTN